MLKHSFKMIWAERKSNTWILIELIIVFSILWFCSAFVYEWGKTYLQPVGFDIDHTYELRFENRRDLDINQFDDAVRVEAARTIFERVKKNPMIEVACYSVNNSNPYSGSYTISQFWKNGNMRDSIGRCNASKREVSAEYFDVFRIKFQKGRTFNAGDVLSGKPVILGPGDENKFFDESILLVENLITKEPIPELRDQFPSKRPETDEEWAYLSSLMREVKFPVVGVINPMKRDDYGTYERIVFSPMNPDDLIFLTGWTPISVRVKADADKDFQARFLKEMKEQLKVGPYELVGAKPYKDIKKDFNRENDEIMQMAFVIVAFLLINVFLGILGTFRFRANARRGEIGLRCALGSTKGKIQGLLLGETFALLFIASIPGAIIAINVQLTGVASGLGISTSYGIVYAITFVTMLLIVWLATWYPAKKASDIQPAEALHYE